jgi:hypothetical protein
MHARTAEYRYWGTKDSSSRAEDLESCITDLGDGETTVRKLRKRLDAERDPVDDGCRTCSGTMTGHQPGQRTA